MSWSGKFPEDRRAGDTWEVDGVLFKLETFRDGSDGVHGWDCSPGWVGESCFVAGRARLVSREGVAPVPAPVVGRPGDIWDSNLGRKVTLGVLEDGRWTTEDGRGIRDGSLANKDRWSLIGRTDAAPMADRAACKPWCGHPGETSLGEIGYITPTSDYQPGRDPAWCTWRCRDERRPPVEGAVDPAPPPAPKSRTPVDITCVRCLAVSAGGEFHADTCTRHDFAPGDVNLTPAQWSVRVKVGVASTRNVREYLARPFVPELRDDVDLFWARDA